MTLAETLQIKHFQLRAGPELKANSCASHSLSSHYSQPRSPILCFSPSLPFYLFIFLSVNFISLIFSLSLSLLMTPADFLYLAPLSLSVFFSFLLCSFLSCIFIPSLFCFLSFAFPFVFYFLNSAYSVDWRFVDLFLKRRVKVSFSLSSLSLLFNGWDAPMYPNSHTTSSNVMAGLN